MFYKKISTVALSLMASLSLYASDPFGGMVVSDPFGDSIFQEMLQMQQRMHQSFEQMRQGNQLPLGHYTLSHASHFNDKGDHYELLTSIPKNPDNQIDITTHHGILSIHAKVIQKQEQKSGQSYQKSTAMQMYHQRMALPLDADTTKLKADYKEGKLLITLGKKRSHTPAHGTQIRINGVPQPSHTPAEHNHSK